MASFELFYVVHPVGHFENKSFKSDPDESKTGFCQWSSIINGYHRSKFYSKQGTIIENTGIGGMSRAIFTDLTWDGARPTYQDSAWVYNISAKLIGRNIIYSVYNNGMLIHQTKRLASAFSFISTPIIGASRITGAKIGFYGHMSEIIAYSNSLTDNERDTVTGYLLNKYLRVERSSTESFSESNLLGNPGGLAGYILLNNS